jgi:hypothetical protein
MNKDLGALSGSRPTDGAASVSTKGFDPAREGHLLLSRVQCALMDREQARALVRLHPGNFESAQSAMTMFGRATETLAAVFERMGGVETLEALQAIAMEARQGRDAEERPDPKDDSAGLEEASPKGGSNAR